MDGVLVKDRYLIQKKLGQGGFAATYLASDTHLNSRPVVVKVLLEHRSSDAWVLKKFRQEMQALARLDHPGIVAALDSGELPDGKPFLVMQFVKGVTLREEITRRGMHLERTASIVRQLAQALTAAHDNGICHRDVKPENIILQSLGEAEEQAKLLDFGIASVRDALESTSEASATISGSWGYMAPEQLEGRSSPASDVYALGAVAYEMVTGRQPFNADSPAQLVVMQLQGVRVKPQDLRPSLPEAAQECILKALSKDPEARYSRARDFGEALAKALTPGARTPVQPEASRAEGSAQQSLEIAHVLFMDLVGYSTQPMDLQTKYLRALQRIVGETPEFRRAEADHQLMSLPTGDGMALVFFGDPVMPLRCALSIAAGLKDHPELKLRMGVHSGPVYRVADINANSNVAGGGINLAQRVMDCGDAGHILLSRSVAETVKQISTWAPYVYDLGEHSVKHGTRIHLYNFCKGELGNSAVPNKLKTLEPEQPAAEGVREEIGESAAASHSWAPYRWRLIATAAVVLLVAGGSALVRWPARLRNAAPASQADPPQPGAAPESAKESPPVVDAPVAASTKPPQNRDQPSTVTEEARAVTARPEPIREAAAPPSPGSTRVNPKDGLTYVWIPPGTFMMGCSPGDEECDANEKPEHAVTIAKGFWMSQTEVTQDAYRRVIGKNPSRFKGLTFPVENVSWSEAQTYCMQFGGRLPTEAEWEYAARAGSRNSRYGSIGRIAWDESTGRFTHEVMQKEPNAFGLFDMLGNVGEWAKDWYGQHYYDRRETRDPAGPPDGSWRVVRGGSSNDGPQNVRASYRDAALDRDDFVGFRCVSP